MVDHNQIAQLSDDALYIVDHEKEDDITRLKIKDGYHFCTKFVVKQERGQHDATCKRRT